MTDSEKKLLQAQHRLEEAQARDRVKERKARTRRLIQKGAILEKVLPEVRTMESSVLEDYLMQKLPQQPHSPRRAHDFRRKYHRPFGVVSKCALREKKEEGPRFPGDLPSEI